MTTKEQIIATLIGTTSGFVFSLLLFWIKESLEGSKRTKHLLNNLHYEFEYNLNLFKKFEKHLTECMEEVTAEKRNIYLTLEYNFVATYFALEFYRNGLISKYLHYEDMKRWNDYLTRLSAGSEKYVVGVMDSWKDGKTSKENAFDALKFERTQVKFGIEMTEYLMNKIPKK